METRYFKKKLSATTTEQSMVLPRLIEFHLLNIGNDNVYVEPDNSIDEDSLLIPAGSSVTFKNGNYAEFKYKAVTSTATLYLYGTRHFKN